MIKYAIWLVIGMILIIFICTSYRGCSGNNSNTDNEHSLITSEMQIPTVSTPVGENGELLKPGEYFILSPEEIKKLAMPCQKQSSLELG